MKTSLVATRVFFILSISLLLFAIFTCKFPALAIAQSDVPDEVNHDTPGQVIKPGHPSISM